MRGKVSSPLQLRPVCRITPAYAGKSLPSRACPPSCWDHPRVCGEKRIERMVFMMAMGITPAYAGKRFSHFLSFLRLQDHPRVCGEKVPQAFLSTSAPGSPPRMRGKVRLVVGLVVRGGITPAYAGKSKCPTWKSREAGDHPRVCGEKHASQISEPSAKGSPPRMRGKVRLAQA